MPSESGGYDWLQVKGVFICGVCYGLMCPSQSLQKKNDKFDGDFLYTGFLTEGG